MFTGLIETTGTVRELIRRGEQAELQLQAHFDETPAIGESIAINGCCLTVTAATRNALSFDLLGQTLEVTALGDLQPGSLVNLERALCLGERLGGHLVLGHVDTTGIILQLKARGQDHQLDIALPPSIARLCIEKGSLAIDGISLTIAELGPDFARFWIIPHTYQATNLCRRKVGERVNLEADMLAKHVARLQDLNKQ